MLALPARTSLCLPSGLANENVRDSVCRQQGNPARGYSALVQLDAFGYDEAAEYIYGCGYAEWKKQYQTNATKAQLYVIFFNRMIFCIVS